jgi:hypothetical protein
MPINPRECFDFYDIFDEHKAEFDVSATFASFCDAIDASYLKSCMWAPPVYDTAKAGKRTWRPLEFPRAECFSELFESAVFVETKQTPRGYMFLSGGLCMHVGGKRGWSKDHSDIRSHYGSAFFGTYVKPKKTVYNVRGYEAIRREDGILILANDGLCIGSAYLALIPLTESIETLFDEPTKQFIAKERQGERDAWETV